MLDTWLAKHERIVVTIPIRYATAIEHGWRLVTKDRKLRTHSHPRAVAVW